MFFDAFEFENFKEIYLISNKNIRKDDEYILKVTVPAAWGSTYQIQYFVLHGNIKQEVVEYLRFDDGFEEIKKWFC